MHFKPIGFAEQTGPAVAQLTGPMAKLVTAVHAGQRLGAADRLVAGQGLQQRIRLQLFAWQSKQLSHRQRAPDPVGRRQGLGCQCGVEVRPQLVKRVAPHQAGVLDLKRFAGCIHGGIVSCGVQT